MPGLNLMAEADFKVKPGILRFLTVFYNRYCNLSKAFDFEGQCAKVVELR